MGVSAGAIIGKEGNSTFKIDTYVGKDIQNYDTMTTTGGSIGASLGGKPKITDVGFNQDSRDRQGITRNTVVGDVEIAEAEGNPINRDLGKANEVTKDTHSRTNINVEPQVIEYISNPAKFKEDLEVAILEGKATGETVLKSIENIVNGGKEDIGDPERRAINEIKEAVIRVKTAPQMESIAKAKDLNSPDVLKELDIAAIEKYDPYDPNLPIKVRQRVEKTLKDGKIPGVFYDKTTNKIFVYKGMENDLEIRAGIAREWKISEDLKDEKGKPNEEGRLKATVAGELAYDDMMKRGREGKTESISTDRFADAVMDEDSEVTSDIIQDNMKTDSGSTGNNFNIAGFRRKEAESIEKYKKDEQAKKKKKAEVVKYKNGKKKKSNLENAEDFFQNPKGYLFSSLEQTGNNISYGWIKLINEGKKLFTWSDDERHRIDTETEWAKEERDDRNTDSIYRADTPRREKQEKVDKVKNYISKAKSPTEKKALEERLESVEGVSIWKKADKFVKGGLTSAAFTTAAGEVLKDVGVSGNIALMLLSFPIPLGIKDRIINPEYISKEEAEYMKERYPEYYSSISQNRYFEVDETRSNLWSTEQKEKVDRGALYFYAEKNNKELETASEIGGAVGTVAVMGWNMAKYSSAEKLGFNSENYTGNSNNFYEKPPLDLVEIDGIYQVPEYPAVVLKSGGSLVPVTNTNTSLVPFNPNTSTGMSVTNLSSAGIIGGIVVPNLITSGKSVTTLEVSKNPVVKPVTKVEQNIETVKQPAVTSEKPKTVERSHSQGSNNHNSNKESFNQKTEKNSNRNSAGENYGTEKTSNKMPPFANRENIHRNSNTPNYDYKVQDNSTSNGSSNGDSGSKKNIEPSVEDSGKTYILESQNANWNFNSEIPKTVVKNSEGNYILGKNNEWSVNNTVTSVKKMETSDLNDVYKVEINNGITPNYVIVNGQNFLTMKEYNNIATKMSDSIKPLNAIKDPVLNVETVREYLADNSYIKSKFLKENKLTVAIGKITLSDGTTENVIAVNGWDGKVWKNGKIPNSISIETMDNQIFKVIKDDNPSLKKFDNWNHAEKKIVSYAQDNYSGKISKIEISVQNNSLIFPGMCEGCNKSMFDFYQKNPKTDITIYEGTTGKGK